MTAGESHGPRLVALVEGIPAGLPLLASDIDEDLARRQRGYARGGRMKIETDRVEFGGGVRDGATLGSPIAMTIVNRDHQNWLDRMSPGPLPAPAEPLTRPRPGHADHAGGIKYDRKDLRDVLERASAREAASRTAVGAVAIGLVKAAKLGLSPAELKARARALDLACADPDAEVLLKDAIRETAHAGDTLGGVFEVVATGVPTGLGAHVQWDRKLDGRLAQALMSIQAIKGVEVGDGWKAAESRGSQVHDAIYYDAGLRRFTRTTNRAGGLEGGISNGEAVVCRAAMKPIATLKRALPSVDIHTKEAFDAAHERSDICAVAAASIVGEAMVAITLCDALLEKFGGDSLRELVRNVDAYRAQVEAF